MRKQALFVIALLGWGCGQGRSLSRPDVPSGLPEAPHFFVAEPYRWPESPPEQHGLDASLLEAGLDRAEALDFVFSILVVRDGVLVAERYFHGAGPHDAYHIHSASKSVTSALVGVAVGQGFLSDLDARLLDYLPEYAAPDLDPRKYDITVRHLLHMQAGFDWRETQESLLEYSDSRDWSRYTIALPLRNAPGEVFNYGTPQTDLLAVVVARASGMSARELAEQWLLGPLGISIRQWLTDPLGNYAGGHAMFLVPRDMARLGYLYLRDGWIDGQRVLPEGWVEATVTRSGSSGWDWGVLENEGYGYPWWLGSLAGHPVFFACGKGGQIIMDVPDLDMVVVTTTNAELWSGEWQQIQQMLELIAQQILPAAS